MGSIYDERNKYLPDGIWNNVSAHVEWINNLVAKKLTAEVRRDFQFTKRKCEGGSVGKADRKIINVPKVHKSTHFT